jgi:hypothetical protein
MALQAYATVSQPPVILEEGTAGNRTIYTNGTSAKVSVTGQGDFNHVLKFIEKDNSSWKVRLSAYDQSNITRLKNCSIYIYDGSNSTQIVILNGTYKNQTGPWYDLNASDTEYIWMYIEAPSDETFHIYTYLEIKVPDKTVYARYIITFEIIT